MPKAKAGKSKKKRNVLQVTVPRSSHRSPNKDKKVDKDNDQSTSSKITSGNNADQSSLETRSKRTPKPRKIIDLSSPQQKGRSQKSVASKGNAKKNKRTANAKKKPASKGATKGSKGSNSNRGQGIKEKRKRPAAKKPAKATEQPSIKHDPSDSGEDERPPDISRSQLDTKTKILSRPRKRLKIEEEEFQEELVPLPPESEEEEEEVDEEEDEVDDSLFFGLPPEKSLDDQDGLREPETYSCSHCREKFKKEDLPDHLSQCPDRYVQCRECGKVLSNLQTLERHHKRFHLKIREVPCTLCDKMFIDEAAARKHLKTVHFKVKNYHCPHCDKAFSQRNKLTYHVRTHSGEKPYSCTECGRSFSLLWNLKTHMRTHTGEKPYACDICGRQFTQKQNMTSHMTTHRKPKPDRRTFPGLTGNDLNGSSTTFSYDSNTRSNVSNVKSHSTTSKPYSFPNMLKTNYISTSKPSLQGIGQQYLLDDVASVVDVSSRQDVQTKIASQAGLSATTAQINQNLLNQQILNQHGQAQINVETGLGLLSAVARKGDESNVQVDGIVSLEQNQQNSTGNASLDQVVEVFLQSNANESAGDHFIPSMVGAETMVSTSEMEQEASAVVDSSDHQTLLSPDPVMGEKIGDGESSPNKQMVGQITAQTVIPVDQANLAGLANILQNPEILAAINAASSSNKFIVIGPVGMFSNQQTGTTTTETVSEGQMMENVPQSFQGLSASHGEGIEATQIQNEGLSEASEFKVEEVPAVNLEAATDLQTLPEDSGQQTCLPESNESHTITQPDNDDDHKYIQNTPVVTLDQIPPVTMEDTTSSCGNVIQISSSFTKAIAGMSSRITTNNISDVTAALINEIQGQIQSQGSKTAISDDSDESPNTCHSITEASGVMSLSDSCDTGFNVVKSDAQESESKETPMRSEEVETIAVGIAMGSSLTTDKTENHQNNHDSFSVKDVEDGTQLNNSERDSTEIATVSHVYTTSSSAEPLNRESLVQMPITGSSTEEEVSEAQILQEGVHDAVSATEDNANAVYLSQISGIVTGQLPSESMATDQLSSDTGGSGPLCENAETTETAVVVNPSIMQSLLTNMNISSKQADNSEDFSVIDIATGSYIETSNILNSVPVTTNGLEVRIDPEQMLRSATDCDGDQENINSSVTIQATEDSQSEEQSVDATNINSESSPVNAYPQVEQIEEITVTSKASQ